MISTDPDAGGDCSNKIGLSAICLAQEVIRRRKARTEIMPRPMLVDATWDVLLHLYVGSHSVDLCSTEALADELELSHNVAARWMSLLMEEGLVMQWKSQGAGKWSLTEIARTKLTNYFQSNF